MQLTQQTRTGRLRAGTLGLTLAVAGVAAAADPRAAAITGDRPEREVASRTVGVLDDPAAIAEVVLTSNPELEALEAQVAALEQTVIQAGAWTDPMLGAEYSSVPLTRPYPGVSPMSGIQLRLEQRIPGPGKIDARRAVASGRVEEMKVAVTERANTLVGLVQDLYWRLALVRQLQETTDRHVGLLRDLIRAVRANYEAGRASQHDLLQLTVLQERLRDDLLGFSRQDREVVAALNAALHRPSDAPIGTPAEMPPGSAPPALEQLVEAARSGNPALAQLAAAARIEGLGARRAEAERRPDVTVYGAYRFRLPSGADPGEDLVTAGVAVPLPWFWNDERWGALAAEHQARRRSLESRQTATLDELRGRLDAALARWRRGLQQAQTYESKLIPAQRVTLESTLASYGVGRADFATLYQAELSLLDLERIVITARADAVRAAVEVATLTGAHVARDTPPAPASNDAVRAVQETE